MGARDGDRPERFLLGLRDPVGAAAARILSMTPAVDGEVDLTACTVVVPGGRARRQLTRALVIAAERADVRLVPPRFALPSDVEFVVHDAPPLPLAEPLLELFAWRSALDELPADVRTHLLGGPRAGFAHELAIVRRLADCVAEIRAAELDLQAVAEAAAGLGADGARYLELRHLARAADGRLAALGCASADTARDRALAAPVRTGSFVYLFGTVDLTARARRALRALGARVVVLAIGESSRAAGFDEFGSVVTAAWLRDPPDVPIDRIVVADRPLDQAGAVVRALAARAPNGRLDPDRHAVVIADPEVADEVARELGAAGVVTHDARGVAFTRTLPARVLRRLAAHVREATTHSLRELLAEPAIERAVLAELPTATSALAIVDAWRSERVDRGLDDVDADGDTDFAAVLDSVAALVAPFATVASLDAFVSPLLALLARLFAVAPPAADRGVTDAALRELSAWLGRIAALPAAVVPSLSGHDALDVVLTTMHSARVRTEPRADELDLVGWLELPFDPCDDAIVVGANDGRLPAMPIDPWLPEALRRRVGLPDQRQRTARDMYVLSIALGRGAPTFVFGRRNSAGEPLKPSRLFLTGRGATLAHRVLRLTAEPPAPRVVRPPRRAFAPPPGPTAGIPLAKMHVTAFTRWLESPYRFWLERVLHLDAPDPASDELGPAEFGNLLHAVLESFGRDPEAGGETDRTRIVRTLDRALTARLARQLGPHPDAGLRIQMRILRERLARFADAQAELAQQGWRIHAVERPLNEVFEIPGDSPIELVGRIDRIDFHPATGTWRILDYKTSDTLKRPDGAHLAKDGSWRSLQLPLYHHLVAANLMAESPGPIELGYCNLAADGVSIDMATRLVDRVPEAVACAQDIVRQIRTAAIELDPAEVVFESEAIARLCRTAALAVEEAAEDDA